MKNIVVVGSGFSGAVLAREIAEQLDEPVKVIEKRSHIGGNMYDEVDDYGVLIQKYGPHIICTNKYSVIEYLSRFSEFFKHTVKLLSNIDGSYVRLPFNFETLQQLIGLEKAEKVMASMRKNFAGRDRVPILEIVNCEDMDVSEYGNLLFEKAYRTYCAKQWGIPVETIDKSVMERVPMAMNYDERYMNKDFQYLPCGGFSKLFEEILNHKNITVSLKDDAIKHISFDSEKSILYDNEHIDLLVFTGEIDKLFRENYGELPYRSLDFKYEHFDAEKVLPEAICSYPQAKLYTRKTEYSRMMSDTSGVNGSTIATEYPISYDRENGTPYYPILTAESIGLYKKYLAEAQQIKGLFLCGRLAEFKYYNMDDCILHAFDVFDEIKKYLNAE